MQKETRFKTRVLSFLRSLPNTWVVKVQQVAILGTPDLIGCVNGYFIAIELKSSNVASITALQKHNLSEISRAGGISLVITPESWFKDRQTIEDLAKGLEEKVS